MPLAARRAFEALVQAQHRADREWDDRRVDVELDSSTIGTALARWSHGAGGGRRVAYAESAE